MRWRRIAGWLLLATVVGLAIGAATASRPASGPGRPAAVEAVLKALDRDDAADVSVRLAAAGPVGGYPAPWRDELVVAAAASRRDFEALWRIGTGRPGAAAARALLYVYEKGATADVRARAFERLKADYPDSWVVSARGGGAAGGPR